MDIFTNNVFIFYVILLLFACFFLYVLCIFVFYVKSCPYSHPAIHPPQPKIRAALSDSYFLINKYQLLYILYFSNNVFANIIAPFTPLSTLSSEYWIRFSCMHIQSFFQIILREAFHINYSATENNGVRI